MNHSPVSHASLTENRETTTFLEADDAAAYICGVLYDVASRYGCAVSVDVFWLCVEQLAACTTEHIDDIISRAVARAVECRVAHGVACCCLTVSDLDAQ